MKNKRKNILRIVISSVLSLILATAMTLLGILWSVSRPISYQGIFDALEECNYTDEMIVKIKEDFEMLCETSGVPPSLADTFLREEVTRENMLFPLEQMFGRGTQAVDSAALKEELAARIEAYAVSLRESGELETTEEEWEEMKAGFPQLSAFFVEEITTAIHLKGIYSTLGAALGFARRLVPYAVWASLPILLVSLGMLCLIWKRKTLFFGYLTASAAGVLLLIPSVYLTASNFVMRLGLDPKYLRLFLNSFTSAVCHRMMIAGVALLVLGILCGVLFLVLFTKEKETLPTERTEENDS